MNTDTPTRTELRTKVETFCYGTKETFVGSRKALLDAGLVSEHVLAALAARKSGTLTTFGEFGEKVRLDSKLKGRIRVAVLYDHDSSQERDGRPECANIQAWAAAGELVSAWIRRRA